MPGQRLGSIVGATFGLIYVLINAGQLPLALRLPLRAAGAVAFLAALAAVWRIRGVAPTGGAVADRVGGFGRPYWLVAGHAGVQLVPTVSGIIPGALLLASGWWGAHRTPPRPAVS
jgi:hypothetical protein